MVTKTMGSFSYEIQNPPPSCRCPSVEADGTALRNELLSYERKVLKEGTLVKARLSHRQRRQLFLLNDVLLYAAKPSNDPF